MEKSVQRITVQHYKWSYIKSNVLKIIICCDKAKKLCLYDIQLSVQIHLNSFAFWVLGSAVAQW